MKYRFAFLIALAFAVLAFPLTSVADSLEFTQNKGQIVDFNGIPRPDIAFIAEGKGVKIYFSPTSVIYVFATLKQSSEPLSEDDRRQNLRHKNDTLVRARTDMNLTGANPNTRIISVGEASEHLRNYYLAHCPNGIVDVHSFGAIFYENVYPQIDAMFYASEKGGMKYEFFVRPGGNPSQIRMEYSGADAAELTADGRLLVTNMIGTLEEQKPKSFVQNGLEFSLMQRSVENRSGIPVHSEFVRSGNGFGFKIGQYDASQILVIDPDIMWATYHGGGNLDAIVDMQIDSKSNAWTAGTTMSSNFPTTVGAFKQTYSDQFDLFFTKFSANGVRLYSTYYGGGGNEQMKTIAIDANNYIIACGTTTSQNFPVSPDAAQPTIPKNVGETGFLLKFDSLGVRKWATYWGGNAPDFPSGVTTDKDGNVILIGITYSSNLQTTPGAIQTTFGGGTDLFVSKFNPQGGVLWSTYLGGTNEEHFSTLSVASGINAWNPVLDTAGNIYLTGSTFSSDFPITWEIQSQLRGTKDAFFSKISPGGTLLWSTYYGGSRLEMGADIAIDYRLGNVFFLGFTTSADFPVTAKAVQSTFASLSPNWNDNFVVKMTQQGDTLWSTYYGGAMNELQSGSDLTFVGRKIAADRSGNCYIVGASDSPHLPITDSRTQPLLSYRVDAYIAKFNSLGEPLWGAYYGGRGLDFSGGVSIDSAGNVVMVGYTDSTITIAGKPIQATSRGGMEVFAVKYNPIAGDFLWSTYYGGNGDDLPTAFAIDKSLNIYIAGQTKSSNLTVTNGIQPTFGGQIDGFLLKISDCATLPTPTVSITTGSLTFCEGGSVELILNSPAANKVYGTIRWSTGVSQQSIVVSSSGTYTVYVTNEFGCPGSTSVTVRVLPNPRPTISSDKGTALCVGDKAILTAPSGFVDYKWSNGLTGRVIEVSTSATYSLTVINSDGCSGSTAITITVYPKPAPLISANSTTTFCEGGSVTLEIAGTFATYLWSDGSTTPTITVKTSGIYSVEVGNVAGCKGQSVNQIQVVVNPRPLAILQGPPTVCVGSSTIYYVLGSPDRVVWDVTGITPQAISSLTPSNDSVRISWGSTGIAHFHLTLYKGNCRSDSTFDVIVSDKISPTITADGANNGVVNLCEGESVTLKAGEGYGSYLWSNGATSSNITVSQAGEYSVFVKTDGCFGTSNTITVNINPRPNPQIQGAVAICSNLPTVYAVPDNAGHSYKWTVSANGTITSADNLPQITVRWNSGASGTVSVKETINQTGCWKSADYAVTIRDLALPTILGANSACEGQTVTLSTDKSYTSYQWSTGETTPTISVTSSQVISLTVKDAQGCSAMASQNVIFTAKPTPIITPQGSTTFCQGDSVQLDAGAGFASYQWSNGAKTQKIGIKAAGNYTVTVANGNGCVGTSASISITVHALPTAPTITRNGGNLVSSPASGYQWFIDGQLVAGANSQTIAITKAGNYTVRITDGNGCSNISLPFAAGNASTTVAIRGNSLSGTAGQKITLPLEIRSSQNLALSNAKNFKAVIRFNKTMLLPTGATPMGITQGNDRIVTLQGTRTDTIGILANVECIAALGNAESTPITIESFEWTDGAVQTATLNGEFQLLGICKEGGTRLMYETGALSLVHRPNPVSERVDIEYELREPGFTRLRIMDELGRERIVLAEGIVLRGRFLLSVENQLPSGIYFLVLETPTQTITRRFDVVK